jgi:RNA polymerase sigma factor, sigma-70 family
MILNNKELAQEVTQEVFIIIFTKLDSLKNYNSLKSWIYKITTNTCMGYIKKEKKILIFEDTDINNILENNDKDADYLIEDIVIHKETKSEVMQFIYSLPEHLRIPVILFYYNDMSYQDISEILNCPEGTVKSRIYNAKKHLKNLMSKGEINYGQY